MIKRYRDLLRVVVADLRHTLSGRPNATNGGAGAQRGDLDRELERLGIAPDGTVTPFDALPNPTPTERRARRVAEAQLAAVSAAQRAATRSEIVERAAYTWINRLLALRAMEARGLINEILRSDPAYDGLSEALFILRQTQPARAGGPDGGWWAVIEDACGAQAASLPGLLDLADPSAALRPSTPALLRCVALIGTTPAGYTAEEADATFADPDAIGWAYQFYQEEAKARTYAKLNSGGKAATRAEIASVTQLFTEPYMVKWLLQNSLGRTYHEIYPDSRLPETWEYYIRDLPRNEADQSTDPRSAISNLDDLTFMDPCMGSGHFEREAFDMYFAMYREQYPDMSAAEIADCILTHHLHGIDLDPRAAQLAALTLYLRAWELVRDERRAQRLPGPGSYRPPAMNLATTPTGLTPGSLERHLQRHPEDRIYRPLLEGIFAALEQADVLGSLLRPGEQLDAAIRAFRKQGGGQLGLLAGDDDLNRLLGELARHDPGELKRVLLERVARSFVAEAADADDVAMSLFGHEAFEGVRLLHLLDRQYSVVATNPPYMGSRNMPAVLQAYTAQHYRVGKRDLFGAFMLRCLELCQRTGRLAMVTMHSWMFLQSFAEVRVSGRPGAIEVVGRDSFRGLLLDTTFEVVAHLGANAFGEITGEIVQSVMFCLQNRQPHATTSFVALRLVELESPRQKSEALLRQDGSRKFIVSQGSFLSLPDGQLAYWVRPRYLELLSSVDQRANLVEVKTGVVTGENDRFVRGVWEIFREIRKWRVYAKGGGYRKWCGLENWLLRWPGAQSAIAQNPTGRIKDETFFGRPGWNYSLMANGNFAVRFIGSNALYDNGSPVVFTEDDWFWEVGAILQTRVVTYLLRLLSQSIRFNAYYVV